MNRRRGDAEEDAEKIEFKSCLRIFLCASAPKRQILRRSL
jgi:hypothetical protein